MTEPDHDDLGTRLAAQTDWLRMLMLHLAGRRVRAHADVEDLVQETLLRSLATPAGLPPAEAGEAPLRRLLARIARNTVMDVLRRIRALKRSAGEVRLSRADWSVTGLSASRVAGGGAGPATRAGLAEEQRELLRAFDTLSSEHRRVLGLRQFEGLSAAETGRRMGRSETAVHSLYRRALAAWHDAVN